MAVSEIFAIFISSFHAHSASRERGRTPEYRGKEGQPDSDSQTSFLLIELDVHVYIARCLYRVCKGFEGPTPAKQPCKVVTAPKSCSPSTNCVASGWSGSETVESDIQWQKISTKEGDRLSPTNVFTALKCALMTSNGIASSG